MNLHFSTFSLAGLEKASFVVSLRSSFELERLLFGVTCRQISSADFTIVITILWYKIYVKDLNLDVITLTVWYLQSARTVLDMMVMPVL